MSEVAPVAFFVYSREDHVRQTIEALKKNYLANETDLIVFSDGPRDDKDIEKVAAVRRVVKNITGFKNVKLVQQTKNYGLANNIIGGVTKVVNEYGKVIVLEDDIVTSPYFLKYMNDALNKYSDEDAVMSISAYQLPINNSNLGEAFFTYFTSCWGWATWDKSWNYFKKAPSELIERFDENDIYRFNMQGSEDVWSQVLDNVNGKINTWAVFWYASVFQNNGLVLHPCKSLVDNIGIDGTGTHCRKSSKYDVSLSRKPVKNFPEDISNNEMACERIFDYLSKKSFIFKKISSRIIRALSGA